MAAYLQIITTITVAANEKKSRIRQFNYSKQQWYSANRIYGEWLNGCSLFFKMKRKKWVYRELIVCNLLIFLIKYDIIKGNMQKDKGRIENGK